MLFRSQPLPVDVFDCRLLLSCRVDTKARVCVCQCLCSVPVRFVGRRLDVRLGAERVQVFDGVGKGVETLVERCGLALLGRRRG